MTVDAGGSGDPADAGRPVPPATGNGAGNGNGSGGRFRAPHRREAGGPRIRERVVITAYRLGSWVLGRLPFGPTVRVAGWLSDAVWWAWPEKRRYVRGNAARILGLPQDDRRVAALGRAVFRNQTRWVIEGFHLPRMSRDEHVALFEAPAADALHAVWEASDGLILVGLHIGNGEAAAAGLAGRGWPIHVLADDTAYEALFERMVAQRRAWGVEAIRWRNIRDVYRVLRNHQILGLLVDWGYRPDGQPVRLLGSWTTLPSGPAMLAARTGATILPFWTVRRADGTFFGAMGHPITVATTAPADIARATQAIADALEPVIREAPEQWCVFKPMWPDDPAQEALLAERARAALELPVAMSGQGRPLPGAGAAAGVSGAPADAPAAPSRRAAGAVG